MRPQIELVDEVLAANARRWQAHAGVPVWAVVKADGYGWGAARLVEALNADVEGYFVADAAEARAIRPLTARPVAFFAAAEPVELPQLLEDEIVPNVASLEGLAAAAVWARRAGRPARIRVGIVPAAGWSGLLEDAVEPFARAAADAPVAIELWTHLTVPSLWHAQRERFARARAAFLKAGAHLVATDVAGTFASGVEGRSPDARVRIGIGLFGARGDDASRAPQLECALRISATVVDGLPSNAVPSAGYREAERLAEPWLAVVRCGYSDGLPARLAGTNEIVSVGMQYTVLARKGPERIGEVLRLLDTSSDLCTFLRATGTSPHEFVVGFREGINRENSVIGKR